MKKLVLSILTVTAITAYSQTCEETVCNEKPKKTINAQEAYESGEVKEEGTLKLHDFPAVRGGCCSGRVAMTAYTKDGKWTEYYENGKKKRVVIYTPGKAPKIKKQWDEDGNKIKD